MQRLVLIFLFSALVCALWNGAPVAAPRACASPGETERGPAILKFDALRNHVNSFNSTDHTHFGQAISNEAAADWMADNVPLFECPDKDIEEIYHFRWWTFRKHIKKTPEGFVITEFLPKVGWSGKHNTISCPAGHHFREGRWIRDKKYLDDYAVFWFRKGGSPRRYSFWAADAVYQHALVLGDFSRAVDILPDLVANYEAWEESRLEPDGLFWQIDDRDGMEVSIGGSGHRGQGKRATINSYMYGDARAIAAIAERAGKPKIAGAYKDKAARLKRLVLEKLWDDDAKFFKVLPRGEQAVKVDVRELHGFTPWYFNLPEKGRGYEDAWKQVRDPKGFNAPFGPTVAEQRHPRFAVSYKGHECQWNGPSWPFATAVTLTALANVLNNYPQQAVSSKDYFETLKIYTKSHRLKREDGTVVPWIDENLNPYNGDWIARTRLKTWKNGTWDQGKGGVERGKDYNHSTYCDLIITGLVGLRPRADDTVEVHPLLPDGTWDYFCLDGVPYHGRMLTILYDKTGKKYGRGSGLRILANGKEIGASAMLGRLTAPLPRRSYAFINTAKADEPPLKGLTDVAHDRVELIDGFWAERQKTHHEVTIPHALDCLEADGHVTNFDRAAGVSDAPIRGHHAFDSDLHKALEGALYILQHRKDEELKSRVDNILDRIIAAQGDDGFLISCYLVHNQENRWENMRLEHQLYNAGHFFEMAVEHKRLTGGDKVLNAARRFADHIDGIFGPGKRYDVGGHEEVELALVKLYRATGEKKYLELSRFFLDERGHAHGSERKPFTPGPFVAPERVESQTDAEYNRARWHASLRWRNGRMQDHKPLVDQHEAIGHAVRAGYIYSAMADIARFMDAPKYEAAVEKIWENVVFRKMYITGGLGTAQYHDEGFGDPYLLPNRTYCESCASIAHVFWQHRMNLLKGEAEYADVMELALYNGAISGIQLSGDAFFYQNPLESPDARRRRWIGLSCCPTNLTRIIPQVGGFAYAQQKGRIHVNLYLDSKATFDLEDGTKVTLRQTTDYPWDDKIRLTVDPQRAADFTLCLRIPGWAQGRPVPSDLYCFAESNVPLVTLKVNGKPVNVTRADDGYVHLKRTWQSADRALSGRCDTIDLDLPMPFRRVLAHEKVDANRGKVALMRGPIVYCVEAVDHPEVDITRITLPRESKLRSEHRPELLGGVTVARGQAYIEDRPAEMVAVPYHAWCNREEGAMKVWIDERESQ